MSDQPLLYDLIKKIVDCDRANMRRGMEQDLADVALSGSIAGLVIAREEQATPQKTPNREDS